MIRERKKLKKKEKIYFQTSAMDNWIHMIRERKSFKNIIANTV